jgi:hypothetical protein
MNNSLHEEWSFYNAAVEALDHRIRQLKTQDPSPKRTKSLGEFFLLLRNF